MWGQCHSVAECKCAWEHATSLVCWQHLYWETVDGNDLVPWLDASTLVSSATRNHLFHNESSALHANLRGESTLYSFIHKTCTETRLEHAGEARLEQTLMSINIHIPSVLSRIHSCQHFWRYPNDMFCIATSEDIECSAPSLFNAHLIAQMRLLISCFFWVSAFMPGASNFS